MIERALNHDRRGLREKIEDRSCPEPTTGCLLWLNATNPDGYGNVMVDSVKWLAHRAAWTVHRGPIPSGMLVLHKCDTPQCLNPDHLFLGTSRDNVIDKVRKGRHGHHGLYGEKARDAKLTNEQADDVRRKYANGGHTHRSLAAEYGVAHNSIGRIVRSQAYAK